MPSPTTLDPLPRKSAPIPTPAIAVAAAPFASVRVEPQKLVDRDDDLCERIDRRYRLCARQCGGLSE